MFEFSLLLKVVRMCERVHTWESICECPSFTERYLLHISIKKYLVMNNAQVIIFDCPICVVYTKLRC